MPNWCDNVVTLRHEDKSKIDALDAELGKRDKDSHRSLGEFFNSIRPNPKGEWEYDWSVNNWGTKWEASIIDYERRDDNEIWVSFESAWSPPIAFYEYLVEEGWNVEAIYQESGMGYAGQFTNDSGDDYYEYDIGDIDSIENLPEDIIEFGDLRTRAEEYLIDRLGEDYVDAERTDWFEVAVKPAYDGFYEIKVKTYDMKGTYVQFAKFDNDSWDYWNTERLVAWRGLAEDPNVLV